MSLSAPASLISSDKGTFPAQERMTQTVIGIAGASGAGKSRLSQLLHQRLRADYGRCDVAILNEDSYYRQRDDLSYEKRCEINYDHPDAMEHSLLVEHLGRLREGETVSVPQYDYSQHNRMSQAVEFRPARIVILEGILLLNDETLRRQLDLQVFVDVPLDICLARRLRRDIQERGRTLDSVLEQYEKTVRPMFYQFIEPSKEHADLIVPGGGENSNALDVLYRYLKGILGDSPSSSPGDRMVDRLAK